MTSTLWRYDALDIEGASIEGELHAVSEDSALARVRDLGYRPVRMRPARTKLLERDFELSIFAPKVKTAELAGSIRQLAAMLRAGVPMMRGLRVLTDQSSPALRPAWAEVHAAVETGEALSVAMQRHDRVFDTVLISLIRAGEASGTLDQTLAQAATALERKAELRRKVRGALAYPIAVLGLVGVVVLAMALFVVPVFRTVYADLGGTLPLPTRMVLGASGFLGTYLPVIVLAVIGGVSAFRRWKRTPQGDVLVARAMLRIPVVGDLLRRTALARAARSLAVLASSGVPLLEALEIAGNVSGNAVMRGVLHDTAEAVRNGRTMSSELARSELIPPLFTQVIAVGEESGDITEMLQLVGDVYEAEVDTASQSFSSVAEPLLIAFLGIVVGGIVLSLYLPMFKLVDLVQ